MPQSCRRTLQESCGSRGSQPAVMICFDNRGKGAECGLRSSLREPRLARPIKTMLNILGVLVDGKTFPAFNREPGVDPQHLSGFGSRLLNLSRLRIGGREPKMGPLQIG